MAKVDYIIPFTLKWEGGLSRSKSDYSSKYPSPYEYKGFKDWHTNKGITYATFEKLANTLNYSNNRSNWIEMPIPIWLKIAKKGYWDKMKLDQLKSQAVANVLFSFMWGSGYSWCPRISRYLNKKGIEWTGAYYKNGVLTVAKDFSQISSKMNTLIDLQGEKKTFEELIKQKEEYLRALDQPKNLPGWLNRLKDLKTESELFIEKSKLTNLPLLIILLGSYFILK